MNYGDEAGTKTFSYLHEKTWSNSSLLCLSFVVVVVVLLLFLLFTFVNPGREHHVHMCDHKNKNKNNCKQAWQIPQQLCGVATTVCKHRTISSISWIHMGNVAAVESSFGLIKPSWMVEIFFFPFRRCDVINVEFKPSMYCLDYLEPKLSPSL